MYDQLIKTLNKVDRPGKVCTGGDQPLTMPGLEVKGLGLLHLPLAQAQARQLIELCRQAPYGKGTQTLVDTDVRRVWELDPAHFQLTNPKWQAAIASIIGDVQQQLGLEDRTLSGHLYKLLVYEKGDFFLPHRDGEKLDRMVATLVVALPSIHEGGELIVWHDGHRHEITFAGAASGYELSYAAFYADCAHQVGRLKSGYRLCLIYNLTLARSRGSKSIAAPSYGVVADEISRLLDRWREAPDSNKLAVTLEHRYTQLGLGLEGLKGIDRARAEALFAAAEQAECVAHLALVTLWQHGSAESDYDDYGYRRGRGYHWSSDEEDTTAGDYQMGEIIEDSLSADHWSDRHGGKVQLGKIALDYDEIVAETSLDEEDPSEEEFEGFTGNAGMTLERWYHRAAIVIWPREQHFAVLCEAGTDAAIGGLKPMVRQLNQGSSARYEERRRACLAFATAIIDTWQQSSGRLTGNKTDATGRDDFPALLCELDAAELLRCFLSQIMPVDGGIQLNKSFAEFCQQQGWTCFEAALSAVIKTATAETVSRNAELLEMLCGQRNGDLDRIALCTDLAEWAVNALETFDNQPSTQEWQVQRPDRAALLSSLVNAMLSVDALKPLSQLIDHSLSRLDKYDLTAAHLAVAFALEPRLATLPAHNPAISRWLDACSLQLEARTAQAPVEPQDYRRPHELPCDCSDCQVLSQFLSNPDQCELRLSVRKDRRQHLHQIIERNHCDLTHQTERRGRPFTLVCTKTSTSYQKALRIHQRDLKNLSRIVNLEKRVG